MKGNVIRYSLLVFVIAVASVTQPTAAQSEQPRQITIQALAPIGLAFGQSLRINVRNLVTPSSREGRRALVTSLIMDLDRNVIAQSSQITLLPNESHTFEFKRDALPLAGEPGTGRVQMLARNQTIWIRDRNINNVEPPTLSAEIVDDATGRTTVVHGFGGGVFVAAGDLDGSSVVPSTGPRTFAITFNGQVGFARDQTLRASIFNPTTRTATGHVKIFNWTNGDLIAQSPELSVPPGKFRFFDLNRESLILIGEAGTGRIQIDANIFLKVDGSEQGQSPSVSLELIDNLTGRTTVLQLPAVQRVRVVLVDPN